MKPTALESLPEDVADLLALERAFPEPSPLRQRRMFNRINSALVTTAATGAAATLSIVVTKAAAPQVAASAAGSGGIVSTLLLKPAFIVAVTAAAATSAVTLNWQDRDIETQTASVQHRSTKTVVGRARIPLTAETALEALPSPAAVAEVEPPPPQATPGIAPALRKTEAEALLAAERAMARGHAARVITWGMAHEKSNPHSALSQERDALVIRALVAQARIGSARERLAKFAQRYPQSIHLAALHAAISQP